MTGSKGKVLYREAQRLETRKRVFEAALEAFRREGAANADVTTIAAAAGIARSTFYFHFPTKDHVLPKLLHRSETAIQNELGAQSEATPDTDTMLHLVTERLIAEEQNLSSVLFRDLLALYLTCPELQVNDAAAHPRRCRDHGRLHPCL